MEEKRNWKEKLMDYSNWKLRNKILLDSLLIVSIIFMVFNYKIDIIWWIPLESYPLATSIKDVINILLILEISAMIILILILFVNQFNKKEEDMSDV